MNSVAGILSMFLIQRSVSKYFARCHGMAIHTKWQVEWDVQFRFWKNQIHCFTYNVPLISDSSYL